MNQDTSAVNGAQLTAALGLGIVGLIVAFFLRRRYFSGRRLPPGPWGLPWLGYLPWIDAQAPYETLTQLVQRYGRVYSLQLGSVYSVVVADPKLVRQAFAQERFSGRAPLYLTHGIMQGYGLICSEGELWKEHRRFTVGVMRQLGMGRFGDGRAVMESNIMDRVLEFVQSLQENGQEPVDIVPKLRHCIGNIINSIVFGVTYGQDDPIWIWLQHLLDEGFKHVAVAGPLNFLPILRFLPKYRRTLAFILDGKRETHRHYQDILDSLSVDENTSDYSSVAQAYLMEMKRRGQDVGTFTTTQLYHVLADLFGAGTDTAMTTIKWIVLYMILYPDVQKRIQEDIDRVIGRERLPSINDMNDLALIEATIMEVQRLKNVVPLGVPHGTLEDTRLGDYDIPKNAMIIPLLWAMNLDAELWSEPHSFQPQRFLDSSNQLCKPDYFMPFQTGRRMCIGDEFGRRLIFLFTTTILQRYQLSFPHGFHYNIADTPEYGFTLVPKPYEVVVKPRI